MNKISALLNKVDFFEKLAIHGNRHGALKALAYEYPAIDPAMQKKIRDYAVSKGVPFFFNMDVIKKTEDGKLGPITRDLIEKVKQHFKNSDPYDNTLMGPQGDQELFKTITYLSENKTPQNDGLEPGSIYDLARESGDKVEYSPDDI